MRRLVGFCNTSRMTKPADIAPDAALHMLRDGNERFAEGRPRPHFSPAERQALTAGQRPWAVVVGCSDSRVPVEALFDVGPGEVFVVRSAGHVMSEAGYASVRYAVQELGAGLVVVLGHEDCGAVAAALSGEAPDYLRPVTDHVHATAATLPEAVDQHVAESVSELREWFDAAGFPSDRPAVIGAAYQLASGEVHWLD
jgi:carbonic anhydrase